MNPEYSTEKSDFKEYPQSIQDSLIEILQQCEEEDRYIRQRMLRECKQYELYWHGFQYIFWDERVQDFRIPTHDIMEQVASREEVKFIYDYVVNEFKAHGLSIIAALSADIPNVAFSPYDADEQQDVLAARKAEELGKIIQKCNKSKLLFYHALFTLYTNYFVAAYNYYERDERLGDIEIPQYKNVMTKVTPDQERCADCGYQAEMSDQEELLDNCPECMGENIKRIPGQEESLPTQVGTKTEHKGMERIRVRGTLNVKISTYATDQESCGYVIDYYDQHYAYLRSIYPHLDRNKISLMGTDNFERIARMPSIGRLYTDTYLQSLLTLKRVWLRPWMFDSLDKEQSDELHAAFPKGCYFAVIDAGSGIFAEAREECLDDHWTISKGDLSRAVHGDPLGKPMLPMQDLENVVMNLMVESLEHSVPSTFADPEIVDFELYSKQEVTPGAIYPIKNSIVNPSKRLDDYFFTLKTSTLPKESVDFDKIVESKAQFVVGAFPSIFGGPQTEGSKTLGEYQESRNYALQRLSIPYQLLYFWWADTVYKSVKDHISNMISDEKYSIPSQGDRHECVRILMEDFSNGRFDLLIPEAAVDLPTSFSQKKSTIKDLVGLNSDVFNELLFSPENREVTLRYLGMDEFSDLDSYQTEKQLVELEDLLNSAPISDEMTGSEVTSVPIEPEVDDHDIHLRVLKVFLCSERGRFNKKNNPDGYRNVLLHAKAHKDAIMQDQMMNAMAQAGPGPGSPAGPMGQVGNSSPTMGQGGPGPENQPAPPELIQSILSQGRNGR